MPSPADWAQRDSGEATRISRRPEGISSVETGAPRDDSTDRRAAAVERRGREVGERSVRDAQKLAGGGTKGAQTDRIGSTSRDRERRNCQQTQSLGRLAQLVRARASHRSIHGLDVSTCESMLARAGCERGWSHRRGNRVIICKSDRKWNGLRPPASARDSL